MELRGAPVGQRGHVDEVAVDGARTTELSLATGKTREQVLDSLETLVFPQLLAEP